MKKLLAAILIYFIIAPSANAGWRHLSGGSGIGSGTFTPTWQDDKLGAGGFVTDILIYPDGTELARTDTYGFYLWNGTQWNQLFTASTIPTGDLANFYESNNISGYGIGACAYPTFASHTSVGSTSKLYAVWNATIYSSTNKGVSWTNTGQAVAAANGNDSTQKGNSPYVGCDPQSSGALAYVSVPGAAPLKTINSGASWTTVSGITAPTSPNGDLIAFDPTSSVVSGVTQHVLISSFGTGVYESTNGSTFSLTSGTPTSLIEMWVDQFGVLWGVDTTSAYKRVSGTWSTVTSPSLIAGIAIDPTSASEATEHLSIIRTSGHIDNSINGGGTWSGYTFTTTNSASDVPWLGVAQQGQIPTQSGLFMSVGKTTFDNSGNLLTSAGLGVWGAPATVTTNSNYTSQSAGIEQLVTNRGFVPSGNSPLVGVWDKGFFIQKNPDVYSSSQFTQAQSIVAGWDLDCSASTPSYCAGVNNSNIGSGDYSGFSTDEGNTWSQFAALPNGTTQEGGMIAVDSSTDIVDVPGQGQVPYCSVNGGGSWAAISFPGSPANHWLNNYFLTRHTITPDRVTAGVIYAYDDAGGVFASSGGCAGTWTLKHSGSLDATFDGANASMQAVPGNAGNLFFTNGPQSGGSHPFNESFFRSINSGVTWTAVANLKEVRAFGFGAAKPGGGGYPAIFVAGWVSSVWGIWESDDNASTWTQLGPWANNDVDLVTTVFGDPDVYGRVYVGFRGSGTAYYDTATACPDVAFSNTNPNASLTGTVTLSATHSGLVPVTGVSFFVDGTTQIGATQTGASPYSVSWATGGVANGAHTLTVEAVGNCAGSASKTIPITTH